jgi:hypothetical protein
MHCLVKQILQIEGTVVYISGLYLHNSTTVLPLHSHLTVRITTACLLAKAIKVVKVLHAQREGKRNVAIGGLTLPSLLLRVESKRW